MSRKLNSEIIPKPCRAKNAVEVASKQCIKYNLPLLQCTGKLEKENLLRLWGFFPILSGHKCSENLCQVTWQVGEQAAVEGWMLPTQKLFAQGILLQLFLMHGFFYF